MMKRDFFVVQVEVAINAKKMKFENNKNLIKKKKRYFQKRKK
jgi:hypothetical protein